MNRALDIAADVRARRRSAVDVTRDALAAIERENPAINAFHHVFSDEAIANAERIDAPAEDVSPRLRTRLLAGALTPAAWYARALRYQQRFRVRMARLFEDFDILLAPCTPFAAPRFSDATISVGEHVLEPAKHLGILTQPISFAGLPVITAPVVRAGRMPIGVQVIGAPFDEAACFAAARRIEKGPANTQPTSTEP